MGIMDFLMGKPSSVESDPRTKAARDFILDELMRIYGQDPINVPRYIAEVPEQRYSGTNSLLSALGLDTVAPPQLDTVDIGGISAYSSEPYQTQIEADFAEKNPSLYNEIMNRTNPAMTASLTPTFSDMTGGGGGRDPYHGGDSVSDFLDPNNRMGMAEHMARQKRNFADGVTPNPDFGFGVDDRGGVVAIGYEGGQVDPSLANAAGFTRRTDRNPFDMSFGDHMSQIGSDVGTMASKVANDIKKTSLIGRIFGGGK
tara:strand:- start:4463 stop:5233 length:771 start_codon:yes stop_codon:yes gene_type:complete